MPYGHTREKKLILQMEVLDCHFYLNWHLAEPHRTLMLLSNKLMSIYAQSSIQKEEQPEKPQITRHPRPV